VKNNEMNWWEKLIETLFFSLFGFLASWLLLQFVHYAYIGIIVALSVQAFVGYRSGRMHTTIWFLIPVGISTVGGFVHGFTVGPYSSFHEITRSSLYLFAGFLFIYLYVEGLGKEEEEKGVKMVERDSTSGD